MSNDFEADSRSSRTGYRAKRKKTNVVLNSLIVIVLLLIVFVAYMIFSSGNNNASANKTGTKQTIQSESAKSGNSSKDNSSSSNSTSENNTTDSNDPNQNTADSNGQSKDSSANGTADQTKAVVTQGGASADVSKTIENPDWKPVGTSQTGQHTTAYDTSSVDWQEMLSAISYAAGIDQSNMTVWFLGRDNSNANGSIGTIEDKNTKQKYRVYIQWVDGQGWEPTKVEALTH